MNDPKAAGLAELESDPDAQRDWDRDTQALDAIEATRDPARKGRCN